MIIRVADVMHIALKNKNPAVQMTSVTGKLVPAEVKEAPYKMAWISLTRWATKH